MGETVTTGGGFLGKKIMCTLNFAPILAGYNNKSKINNLKLCLLVIKISANTNKLNVDFLNLKIEW